MFTWSSKREQQAAYGLLHSDNIFPGGDIRYLITPKRQFLMEASANVGLKFDWLYLVGGAGAYNGISDSRVHYVMVNPDNGWYFRIGKFKRNYGLMLDDHTALIKRGLGNDQGAEDYSLECGFIGEFGHAVLSGGANRVTLKVETFYFSRSTISLAGELYRPESERDTYIYRYGLAFAGGTDSGTYIFFEIDHEIKKEGVKVSQKGVGFLRLGQFLVNGLEARITRQIEYTGKSQTDEITAGARFLPRPKWELSIDSGVRKSGEVSQPLTILLLHWYL